MAPWGACAKLEASKWKSTNQWVTSWLIYRWCKHFKEAIVGKYQLVKLAHGHQLINHLQTPRIHHASPSSGPDPCIGGH